MQKGSKRDSVDLLSRWEGKLKWFVFLLALLVYANTFNHQYALDDYSVIVKHSHVQKGISGISDLLTTNYRNGNGGFNDGLYRPLSLISFALEKEWFNSNTSIAHGINILLYSFSCFFLFLAFRKIFERYPKIIAFGAVLLFALHPIHTEVVANIKGRDELLAVFGLSLTLYFLLRYIDRKSKMALLFGLFFFAFSLLSKESSVTFLLLIPLLFMFNEDIPFKKLLHIFTLLLPFAIGFMLLRTHIIDSMVREVDPGNFGLLNNPIAATNDSSLRWGSTFGLQLTFLQKLLFPYQLIHDYSFNQIPLIKINAFSSILGIVTFLLLLISALWGILKRNIYGILSACYLVSIAVASQIALPIGVQFAERLLFIPALAFAVAIPMALLGLLQKNKKSLSLQQQKLIFIGVLAVGILYGFKTLDRNADWKNNLSLYSADIEYGGNSARVNYNLGTELNRQAERSNNPAQKSQWLNQAAQYLTKATTLYPQYYDAYNNLGLVYKNLKDYPKAIQAYKEIIKKDPNYSKAHYNLATSYYENKQYENCILSMEEYVQLKPNAANAYFFMGQAKGNLQQFKEAIPYLNQAISLNPNFIDAHNFLGMAYAMSGDNSNAETSFLAAQQLAPNRTDILMNLALCYNNQGKAALKRESLQRILQIDPNHQGARNMLSQ